MTAHINVINPATEDILTRFDTTAAADIDRMVAHARQAHYSWRNTTLEERQELLLQLGRYITAHQKEIALKISQENGKPLWEALAEVTGAINKIDLTYKAYNTHAATQEWQQDELNLKLAYKPLGVLVVLGPFNFPVHLAMGHIVPALLTGNAVVFKPSEHTIGSGIWLVEAFRKVGFPKDIIHYVVGGKEQGQYLAAHPGIQGLVFTGGYSAAQSIARTMAATPEKLLAIECGGNNPLIIASYSNQKAVVDLIIKSAFLTAGQRCTCTRRLIMLESPATAALIDACKSAINNLKIGPFTDEPEPFMGPLITESARNSVLETYQALLKLGGAPILEPKRVGEIGWFVSPGIVDMTTGHKKMPDQECFGPLMSIIRVSNLEEAIDVANQTSYGLSASIITQKNHEFEHAHKNLNAGIINWNRPTNGSSSQLPFGGIGKSGNFRPAGFTAIQSCVYPVASVQHEEGL